MKINDIYNGWRVLDIQDMNEYNADGIWLRHEKTGMEIFHLLNDDEENMFSFGFRTIPNDSTGVAHIIEHSVLAGSERYPLKDPFIVLNNQSIKTYLNAMTFPDKTVYPAASFVEKDYFNLMAVYGDAVFFPLLKEVIFKQEGHRVEIDEKGELSIQGVVYNEMKGNYSSFEGFAGNMAVLGVLEDTVYNNDSGGNPANIPELTYEQFKAFHKAYYNPSNCRLFLAGNIPTEKQIDFINEHFVELWIEKNPGFTTPEALRKTAETQGFRFDTGSVDSFTEPRTKDIIGPEGGKDSDNKATSVVSWIIGNTSDCETYMKTALLDEILLGHDGAPLMRVLLESGLGEDVAPSSGADADLAWITFSAGLRGVPLNDTDKLGKVIFDELERLAREGVPQSVTDAAMMSLEFVQKEIRRGYGPFTMTLMERCYRGWMNGKTPYETMYIRKVFEQMKHDIAEDPDYIRKLVSDMLVTNKKRSLLTIRPDAQFEAEQKKAYEAQLEKARETLDIEELKKTQEEMHVFQETPESEENLKKIPHLRIDELDDDIQLIDTEIKHVGSVPLYTHVQPVNGITYISAAIPVDLLQPEDYQYLPLFCEALTDMGIGDQNWVEVSERIAGIMGGYHASLHTESVTRTAYESAGLKEDTMHSGKERTRLLYMKNNCLGRAWLNLSAKMLDEKAEEGIALMFDNLRNADFSDRKRLHDLLLEYKNDFIASIAPYGNQYASSRSSCTVTRAKAIDEIWNGLSQLYFIKKLDDINEDALIARFNSIKSVLLESGIAVNITAEEEPLRAACKVIGQYLEEWNGPAEPLYIDDEPFYTLACPEKDAVWFDAHTQVGFAALSLPAHTFGTKESVYEELLGRYLSNTILWEKIRTVGGAYGASSYANSTENVFQMSTYRDPVPETSLKVFEEALKEMTERKLSDEELEKVIIGCYSSSKQPRTPSSKGTTAWVRLLYGITDEDRAHRMHEILSATSEDIQNAARKLLKELEKKSYAVIFDKGLKFSGKKVELPL